MPKKTLALISGLVLVTVVLFVVALNASEKTKAPQSQPTSMAAKPTVIVPAHSVLSMNPNPLTLAAGGQGKVDVNIDTSDNKVTAVQLELGYDPNIITNVKVLPGPMFKNPVILFNKDNPTTGRYTYEIAITPNSPTLSGQGVVASVTFTAKPGTTGKQMQLGLLPSSLVTAQGVAESVMKKASGTILTVSGTAAAGAVQVQPTALNTTKTNTTGATPVPPRGGF